MARARSAAPSEPNLVSANASAATAPTTTSTYPSRSAQRSASGAALWFANQRSAAMSIAAGKPLQGRPERSLPSAVRGVRALGRPAGDTVVAAPGRAFGDPDDRVMSSGLLGDRFGERHDVEPPPIRRRRVRGHEALEEQVAELLMVSVELTVGRDEGERWRVGGERRSAGARLARGRSDQRQRSPRARTRPRRRGPRRRETTTIERPPPRSTRYGRRLSSPDSAACHGARIV